jgi:hypothetical protein
MRSIKLILAVLIISGCGSKSTFESRVKKFMVDSVVVNFNDPKSYEFVSMSIDTVTNGSKIGGQKAMFEYDHTAKDSLDRKKTIYSLSKLKQDLVTNYIITVKCRGKNKMGGLILNEVELNYDPATDQIKEQSIN